MRSINTFIIYLPAVPIAGWGVSCCQKIITVTLKILKTDVFFGGNIAVERKFLICWAATFKVKGV